MSSKNERGGIFWRVKNRQGIIGRSVSRTARSITGMIEKVKLPELSKDEQEQDSVLKKKPRPLLFFSEPEPAEPDPVRFKLDALEKEKQEAPRNRKTRTV